MSALINTPLIDHHMHGVMKPPLGPAEVEGILSESSRPPPAGCSNFHKPIGLAVRRECAPVLGLPALIEAEAYQARRAELGQEEVSRRLLTAANVAAWGIDTGMSADRVASPEAMDALSGSPGFHVPRIEYLVEGLAQQSDGPAALVDGIGPMLESTVDQTQAIALKSIIAYRTTFRINQSPPDRATALAAADRWMSRCEANGTWRLDEVDLNRFALWAGAALCRDRNLPLQLHSGLGDTDVYMHACDPSHFTDFYRVMEDWQVPVTLLHNYPFIREAAWLSEVFQTVYYDCGFIVNFAGPSYRRIVQEAFEYGPFYKQLYSSDAYGLPELHYLGAVLFRREMAAILDQWIAEGWCTARDAEAIAADVGWRNAARIYPPALSAPVSGDLSDPGGSIPGVGP